MRFCWCRRLRGERASARTISAHHTHVDGGTGVLARPLSFAWTNRQLAALTMRGRLRSTYYLNLLLNVI
jgi:hypothetical protein